MGILDSVLKKEEKKPKGTCIPLHPKKQEIADIETAEPEEFDDKKPRFMVTGVFEVRDFLMITGEVLSGKIKPKQRVDLQDNKLIVKEVMVGQQKSKIIEKGQTGALIFKPLKHLILKAGNVLEFSD